MESIEKTETAVSTGATDRAAADDKTEWIAMGDKAGKLLVFLCAACYFVSYITRINYGAVILEIQRAEGITKTAVSMAVTGSFVTYGAGQLVSGWMGDRMRPDRLILAGILLSAGMNVCVPTFTEPGLILAFWCVNGFAQALIWPPMVKILSACLDQEQYKKACVRVTWGSSVATIAVYLLAPLCIVWKGWKSLFYLCAGIALCFAVLWVRSIGRACGMPDGGKVTWRGREDSKDGAGGKAREIGAGTGNVKTGKQEKTKDMLSWQQSRGRESDKLPGSGRGLFSGKTCLLLGCIMTAIVMQGTLRDGITTWMPSYISETFHLGSAISILSGVLLPIFSILCLELVSILNRKLIPNEMLCAGMVFLAGFSSTLLLALLPSLHAGLSVFLSALATGCMYGVNLILVSMVPPYFKGCGKVSTVSGMLNSCTYVGSAISGYGIAWVAGQWGWMVVIWLWAAAAAVGTLFCFGSIRRWRQFSGGQESGRAA